MSELVAIDKKVSTIWDVDPQKIDGWLSDDEGQLLAKYAEDKVCLEIGSYKGKSSVYIAQAAKSLLCIDTFKANESGQDQEKDYSTFIEFGKNLAGFENVTALAGTSDKVVGFLANDQFDFLFIDGMHDYNSVVSDLLNYAPKMKDDAVIVFHDYSIAWPGVMRCINEYFGEPTELADSAAMIQLNIDLKQTLIDRAKPPSATVLQEIPIFYVNMDIAKERNQRMMDSLRQFGHEGLRRTGFDGRKLSASELPGTMEVFEHNQGMIGCMVSHYRIWEEVVEKQIPHACILEDDAQIVRRIKDIPYQSDCDILYLNDRIHADQKGVAIDGCGMDGYIVSLSGCEKLLKIVSDSNVAVDLRIPAHSIGFIYNNIYMTTGDEYRSRVNPTLLVKAFKTPFNYVVHRDHGYSYIEDYEKSSPKNLKIGNGKDSYEVETHLYEVDGTGFLVRIGTWDSEIVRHVYGLNEYGISPLHRNDIVMDVGGHIGSFSKLASKLGSANIYTYEANPENRELCRINLSGVSNVADYGLWSSNSPETEFEFSLSVDAENTGGGGVTPTTGDFKVTLKSFDQELISILDVQQAESIRLLKLDCEGSEFPILLTSKHLDKIEEIVGEYHLGFECNEPLNGKTKGFTIEDLKSVLESNGFKTEFRPSKDSLLGHFRAVRTTL